MITRLGVASAYVLDYDQARDFFVDKLGFEVRHDLTTDTGYRWSPSVRRTARSSSWC